MNSAIYTDDSNNQFFTEEDQAKEYCRQHFPQILGLSPDSIGGYICPCCGSGSGPHGTGLTTLDDIHYRCWACGLSGDIFDFAEELVAQGILEVDGANIFQKVFTMAGLNAMTYEERQKLFAEEISFTPSVKLEAPYRRETTTSPSKVVAPVKPPDYTDRYIKAIAAFNGPIGELAREYMHCRGISDETLKRFHIGYMPSYYCGRLKIPVERGDASTANYPVNDGWIDTTNGMGAIAIPVSKDCYVLRNLNKASDKRYTKVTAKGNPFKVINCKVLFKHNPYVFIVEGYVDMLSVEEVGFPAVAIGTIGAPYDLQQIIMKAYQAGFLDNTCLVICEDNDVAGQTGLKRIKDFLNKLPGIKYCCCDPCKGITDGHGNSLKDANDALINNRERFITNLENATRAPFITVAEATATKDYALDDAVNTDESISSACVVESANICSGTDSNSTTTNITADDDSSSSPNKGNEHTEANATRQASPFIQPVVNHLTGFLQDDGSRYVPISTGLEDLNKLLGGGLRVGLTGIGGLSGLGKSTLAIQICDNVAERGIPVLYVSLEMGIDDIISKSLARLMFDQRTITVCQIDNFGDKSNVDILTKNAYPEQWNEKDNQMFDNAVQRYRRISEKLFIVEGGMVGAEIAIHTVDRIEHCIKEIIAITGTAPLVCVDYIQKLKGATISSSIKTNTEKQIIDESVFALRSLATKYKIPVIGILSLNRASYNAGVSLSSAKGSGDIEYSCDVLIGLEKDESVDENNSLAAKTVSLKVIKNRYGMPNINISMDFYGKNCCYTTVGEHYAHTASAMSLSYDDLFN